MPKNITEKKTRKKLIKITPTDKNYPVWVCLDCAGKGMRKTRKVFVNIIATWHEDICGVCGEKKTVTEPRDFGWPTFIKKING